MKILGNLSAMLPEGWRVEIWANRPSIVFSGEKTIKFGSGYPDLSVCEDLWRAGLPCGKRPKAGTVVKANNGRIYVCTTAATPNPNYNPSSLFKGDHFANEFEAGWTELPEEIIFLIWPMSDYNRMPVRN